uniref:Uncharacterized protein n=1 Tax=Romanomermis culicivorax TaxID=13658 RepID=A0A915JKP5_ROMCU
MASGFGDQRVAAIQRLIQFTAYNFAAIVPRYIVESGRTTATGRRPSYARQTSVERFKITSVFSVLKIEIFLQK